MLATTKPIDDTNGMLHVRRVGVLKRLSIFLEDEEHKEIVVWLVGKGKGRARGQVIKEQETEWNAFLRSFLLCLRPLFNVYSGLYVLASCTRHDKRPGPFYRFQSHDQLRPNREYQAPRFYVPLLQGL